MNNHLNVFQGKDSIKQFLNPDNNPPLPLVELPDSLNPYRKNGVRIFAKLMNFLPLGNVKSLPAYNMLLEKDLTGVDTIIENSSGNTVFSLAVIGRTFGIPRTKAIVSHEVSDGKLKLLRLLGTEVIVNHEPICPDPNDVASGIYKAKVWAQQHNWFNPGQYDNDANPQAHKKWTGPQIWNQLHGKVDIFCAGLGTTGTIVGTAQYLKAHNPDIQVIGVTRKPNNPVPGVRTHNLLQEIAFNWKSLTNKIEEVGTVESFKKSLELSRAGLMVGPSSGFALAGLLQHLSKQKFDTIQETIAVFICPDSPLAYIDEYFQYLDKAEFPAIENEHLLLTTSTSSHSKIIQEVPEITAEETYKLLFKDSPTRLWENIKKNNTIEAHANIILIDIRRLEEYEDFHAPSSIHIEDGLPEEKLNSNEYKNKKVIFVCRRGNTSKQATLKARKTGIEAYSLKGGMTEWSRLDLPRIRAEVCIVRYNL